MIRSLLVSKSAVLAVGLAVAPTIAFAAGVKKGMRKMNDFRPFLIWVCVFFAAHVATAADGRIPKEQLSKIFVGTWMGNLELRTPGGRIVYQSAVELTRESIETKDIRLLLKKGNVTERATLVRFEDGVIVLMGEHGLRRLEAAQDGEDYILRVVWESKYNSQKRYGRAVYRKPID